MRIIKLCTSVSNQGAGIAKSVEGLSGALLARGHDVRVFALDDPGWAESVRDWTGASVTVFPVRGPSALGYAPAIRSALIDANPDVVHLHGLWMHTARDALQWSRLTGKPYMVSPHGMLAPSALKFSRTKKRIARIFYQDFAFATAAAFHATSDAETRQIRGFGLAQPICLYPNGVEVSELPSAAPREKVVLSLGRLHPVKGLDVLLDAWALIEPRHKEWRLRILGPDENGYAQKLRRRAAALGLSRISIEGPVYGAEKYRQLATAELFVLPSQSENFGLTVVESLMMSTPVIASQGTPWKELVTQLCGDWVEAAPEPFAKAIDRMISLTEGTRRGFGEKGRSWVINNFSWNTVAAQAEEGYEAMAGL